MVAALCLAPRSKVGTCEAEQLTGPDTIQQRRHQEEVSMFWVSCHMMPVLLESLQGAAGLLKRRALKSFSLKGEANSPSLHHGLRTRGMRSSAPYWDSTQTSFMQCAGYHDSC